MSGNRAVQSYSDDTASPPRLQWSIKAILLLTTLVAIHLALFRANLPGGLLAFLFSWFPPVSLMLLARLVLHFSSRQIAQALYFTFSAIGGMLGAAISFYALRGSPIDASLDLLGIAAAAISLTIISAFLGGLYSFFIIAIYGACLETLRRIGFG